MRRRNRYQSRAAAWCMAALTSFAAGAGLAGDMSAPSSAPVEEAASFTLPDRSGDQQSTPSVAMIQPVEFNPVIAAVGDRIALADADPNRMPTPFPVASMPRLTPGGATEYPPPQYDIQFRFVQDTNQPFEANRDLSLQGGMGGGLGGGLGSGLGGGLNGGLGSGLGDFNLNQIPEDTRSAPGVEGIQQATIAINAPVDAGQLISRTNTVASQQRSPISFDPHIRGYRWGQLYLSSGAQWTPIRPDLDSALSNLDTNLIQSVNIIPGPYGLRYGPGLAYMNVIMVDTPRYANGPESHARLGVNYRGNGDQTSGHVSAYGGGADYGYIFNYSVRSGIDYQAGDGTKIPSSFNSQNFYGQIGFDLSSDSKIELRYFHVEQNNTEYAGQFFDLDYSGTEAATVNYVNEDFGGAASLRADLWYSYSRYAGDTDGPGKRSPFPVIDRVERGLTIQQPDYTAVAGTQGSDPAFTGGEMFDFGTYNPASQDTVNMRGTTNGDQQVAGGRAVLGFGEEGYTQMDVGVDFRYQLQSIQERFNFAFTRAGGGTSYAITNPNSSTGLGPFATNLPRSNSANPGVFVEFDMPMSDYWTSTAGARLDYVYTTAYTGGLFGRRTAPNFMFDMSNMLTNPDDPSVINNNDSSLPVPAGADLEQSDFLYSFYLANDIELTDQWSSRVAFGVGQRAPTLIDRYADGLFLGIFQSGFSRVIGDPNLDEERAWQIDLGLNYEGYNFRGRVNLFHAWIQDYITYSVNTIDNLSGARLYQTINTKYATLAGFEAYGEYDLSDSVQLFGNMAFVEGRDQQIQQSLPGISPFEATTGVRILDGNGGRNWGTEFGARMVHQQERVGILRTTGNPLVVVPVEQATPGFSTFYVRGYLNATDNVRFVGGVENLGNRLYQEHLDLRLPATEDSGNANDVDFAATKVWAPGVTPYIGIEATY